MSEPIEAGGMRLAIEAGGMRTLYWDDGHLALVTAHWPSWVALARAILEREEKQNDGNYGITTLSDMDEGFDD